jgi:hypothetical protein
MLEWQPFMGLCVPIWDFFFSRFRSHERRPRQRKISPRTGYTFPNALVCWREVVSVQFIVFSYCLQNFHPLMFKRTSQSRYLPHYWLRNLKKLLICAMHGLIRKRSTISAKKGGLPPHFLSLEDKQPLCKAICTSRIYIPDGFLPSFVRNLRRTTVTDFVQVLHKIHTVFSRTL